MIFPIYSRLLITLHSTTKNRASRFLDMGFQVAVTSFSLALGYRTYLWFKGDWESLPNFLPVVQWMDFCFLLTIKLLLGMDLKCRHWPLMSIIKFWVQILTAIPLFIVYFWQHDHKQPDCFMDLSLSWANLKEGLVKAPLVYWVCESWLPLFFSPSTRYPLALCIWRAFKNWILKV